MGEGENTCGLDISPASITVDADNRIQTQGSLQQANVDLTQVQRPSSVWSYMTGQRSIVIDTRTPVALDVNSTDTSPSGTYKFGDTIDILVRFDEEVVVAGQPTLALSAGVAGPALYHDNGMPGVATSMLTFRYTISAGDSTAELNYASADPINGGSITDRGGNSGVLELPDPLAPSALAGLRDIVIDAVAPAVVRVGDASGTSPNAAYRNGDTITIAIRFDQPVVLEEAGGTPTLTLTTRSAILTLPTGNTPTEILVFEYVVEFGDNTDDLDYAGTNSLQLNGATLTDTVGNAASLVLAAPGTAGSLGSERNIVVDTTAGSVVSVGGGATTANGVYKAGDNIDIVVQFTEPLKVGGSPAPELVLQGVTNNAALLYPADNSVETSLFTFRYTVDAGENIPEFMYQNATALVLSGSATIRDAVGYDAILTLPVPGDALSLSSQRNIELDTTAPIVQAVGVNGTSSDGLFGVGSVITIVIAVSEDVSVSGTFVFQCDLNLGAGVAGPAILVGPTTSDFTSELTFEYTVKDGDNTADLNYDGASALVLGGGFIRDAAGNDLVLALPESGASNSLSDLRTLRLDTLKPTVVRVGALGSSSGYFAEGGVITIVVEMSEEVVYTPSMTTEARLHLQTGGDAVLVAPLDATPSQFFTFNYTVGASDNEARLDYFAVNSLTAQGGQFRDEAANPAVLALADPGTTGSLADQVAITVDTTAPRVLRVDSPSVANYYSVGGVVDVCVHFSEDVFVFEPAPLLTLGTGVFAPPLSLTAPAAQTATTVLTFSYTVEAGDNASPLDYASSAALALVMGGSVDDRAGNQANLTLANPGAAGSLSGARSIVVDTDGPTVLTVGGGATTGSGQITVNDEVLVVVQMGESVVATGEVQLLLDAGSVRAADLVKPIGVATTELTFRYVIQPADTADPLDYIDTSALVGGSIVDAGNNPANRTLPAPGAAGSLGGLRSITIDTSAPSVISVGGAGTSDDGFYGPGDLVDIVVQFDKLIKLADFSLNLQLEAGVTGPARLAAPLTTQPTSFVTFRYEVRPGDNSPDLSYFDAGSSLRPPGALTDTFGNVASQTLDVPGTGASLSALKDIVIDSTPPRVLSVGSDNTTATGLYKAGDDIDIVVRMDEPTLWNGISSLNLGAGVAGTAVLVAPPALTLSDQLTFRYTVSEGDNVEQLAYPDANSLVVSGFIRDRALNDANPVLPAPGAGSSLSFNRDILIDTTPPRINMLTSVPDSGFFKEGSVIDIELQTSEPVRVTEANMTLALNGVVSPLPLVGPAVGVLSTALTFRYTVSADDTASSLELAGPATALELGTETAAILDATGNSLDPADLPGPGDAGSLGNNTNVIIDIARGNVELVGAEGTSPPGVFGVGDVISIVLQWSEPMIASGDPVLLLQAGVGGPALLSSPSDSTPSLLFTFVYTVVPGDNSAALDYADQTAIDGGIITDQALNDADRSLVSPGGMGSLSASTLMIDTTAPTVLTVGGGSTSLNGTYGLGAQIVVAILFDEPVRILGGSGMTLQLSAGLAASFLGPSDGSLAEEVTFAYIVALGDAAADLGVLDTTSLVLNGGVIQDEAGNSAVVELPSPASTASLAALRDIVVEGVGDIVVTNVGSGNTTASGAYLAGDSLRIVATFNNEVFVSGLPTMNLDVDPAQRTATYVGGSGSAQLTFEYTVQPGDTTCELSYTGQINGGTLLDAQDRPILRTLPPLPEVRPALLWSTLAGQRSIVVDTNPPAFVGIHESTSASGVFTTGDTVDIVLEFSERAAVLDPMTASLAMSTGGQATYYATSSHSLLTFRYLIANGDDTSDLGYEGTDPLSVSVTDYAGNAPLSLKFPAPGDPGSLNALRNIRIDARAANIENVGAVGSTASGSFGAGETLEIVMRLNEKVEITGGTAQLRMGGGAGLAVFAGPAAFASLLTFAYTVQPGDNIATLDYNSTSALELVGGPNVTMTDEGGVPASLRLPDLDSGFSLAANRLYTLDTTAPHVVTVGGGSSSPNGTYGPGDHILIEVEFQEPVLVTADADLPQLVLADVNNAAVLVTAVTVMQEPAASATILFEYVVPAGVTVAQLQYEGINSLLLPGTASIHDVVGIEANVTLPSPSSRNSLSGQRSIELDTTAPSVLGVGVGNTTDSGYYTRGTMLSVIVEFSEPVSVSGSFAFACQLALSGLNETADLIGPFENASLLTFQYLVRTGDNAVDIDYSGTDALTLVGGSLHDAGGNEAVLELPAPGSGLSLGDQRDINVDTQRPRIISGAPGELPSPFEAGAEVSLIVTLSEPVLVEGGPPTLFLEAGGRVAGFQASKLGEPSATLVFRYRLRTGDGPDSFWDTSRSFIQANGAQFRDLAGNSIESLFFAGSNGAVGAGPATSTSAIDSVWFWLLLGIILLSICCLLCFVFIVRRARRGPRDLQKAQRHPQIFDDDVMAALDATGKGPGKPQVQMSPLQQIKLHMDSDATLNGSTKDLPDIDKAPRMPFVLDSLLDNEDFCEDGFRKENLGVEDTTHSRSNSREREDQEQLPVLPEDEIRDYPLNSPRNRGKSAKSGANSSKASPEILGLLGPADASDGEGGAARTVDGSATPPAVDNLTNEYGLQAGEALLQSRTKSDTDDAKRPQKRKSLVSLRPQLRVEVSPDKKAEARAAMDEAAAPAALMPAKTQASAAPVGPPKGAPSLHVVCVCPDAACGRRFKLKQSMAGRRFKCKGCDTVIRAPTTLTSSSRGSVVAIPATRCEQDADS